MQIIKQSLLFAQKSADIFHCNVTYCEIQQKYCSYIVKELVKQVCLHYAQHLARG